MKIRMLGEVITPRGTFKAGDVVEWSENNAWPLVNGGSAELVAEKVFIVKPLNAIRKRD